MQDDLLLKLVLNVPDVRSLVTPLQTLLVQQPDLERARLHPTPQTLSNFIQSRKCGQNLFSDDFVMANLDLLLYDYNYSSKNRDVSLIYKELSSFQGHVQPIYCVTFDKTSKRLITGSDDGLIKIWGIASQILIASLRGHSVIAPAP